MDELQAPTRGRPTCRLAVITAAIPQFRTEAAARQPSLNRVVVASPLLTSSPSLTRVSVVFKCCPCPRRLPSWLPWLSRASWCSSRT